MDEVSIVKYELNKLLDMYDDKCNSRVVDDVLLNYVVGVLENVNDDDDDESFDIEEFIEVMAAYIPRFETIESHVIFHWLKQVSNVVKANKMSDYTVSLTTSQSITPSCHDMPPCTKTCKSTSYQSCASKKCNTEDKIVPSKETKEESEYECKIQNVMAIFPNRSSLEIKQCLSITNGDVNAAIQLMLVESENEPYFNTRAFNPNGQEQFQAVLPQVNCKKGADAIDAKENDVKNFVLSRYSHVDIQSDDKVYAPSLPKNIPKKLVRYRDNQVVSTKGERFWRAKEPESEEIKRTYVNLKPARKYRFH